MPSKKVYDPDIEENRFIASLSYLWLLFLIPLLVKRDSPFAQFHAKQGLVLFIVEVLVSLIMWLPLIGQLLFLVVLIVAITAFIKTLNGERWKIPYLYSWSEKIKF